MDVYDCNNWDGIITHLDPSYRYINSIYWHRNVSRRCCYIIVYNLTIINYSIKLRLGLQFCTICISRIYIYNYRELTDHPCAIFFRHMHDPPPLVHASRMRFHCLCTGENWRLPYHVSFRHSEIRKKNTAVKSREFGV